MPKPTAKELLTRLENSSDTHKLVFEVLNLTKDKDPLDACYDVETALHVLNLRMEEMLTA